MPELQIHAPRERAAVAAADLALKPLAWLRRSPDPAKPVSRILLLRLERIGDLLMTRGAIDRVRELWPHATIDLAVGSWNAPLARLLPGLNGVLVADVPWLARVGEGDSWRTLVARAREWKRRGYDLVMNFEPDIRSNFLAWLTGAPRRVGYWTGGGGAFLTDSAAFAPNEHVGVNALRLVDRAAARGVSDDIRPPNPLMIPPAALGEVSSLLAGAPRPWIGVHVSGGRESKQWHLDRFADVAQRLAAEYGATIVLTGSDADRGMVNEVAGALHDVRVVDVAGRLDLVQLAAVLSELDVLITGDTGPMHLGAAVGTPLVALFGPSDPRRYGPVGSNHRVIRVDLPCSPCGQVRLPPERCRGHVPDCMDGIRAVVVMAAVRELLAAGRQPVPVTT
jgi:lipopolysaccharide heptosyltransferase II